MSGTIPAGGVVEIDIAELACRIMEAILERSRPEGVTAREALEMLDEETQDDMRRAAVAAADYFVAQSVATSHATAYRAPPPEERH